MACVDQFRPAFMSDGSLITFEGIRRSPRILSVLVAGYVALLPFQFSVTKGVNFAPADCLMLLVLLAGGGPTEISKGGLEHMAFRHSSGICRRLACGGGPVRSARSI